MANFNKSDLEFILAQIKIAEDHTAAIDGGADPRTSLLDLIGGSPNLSFGLRTVSGEFNNLLVGRTDFGQADQPFIRLTAEQFLEQYAQPGMVVDPEPRIISNLVVDMTINNPSAVEAAVSHHELAPATVDAILALSDTLSTAQALNALLMRASVEAATAASDAVAAFDAVNAIVSEADVPAAIAAATAAATAAAALVETLRANSDVDDLDLASAEALAGSADALVLALQDPNLDVNDLGVVQGLAASANTLAGLLEPQIEASSAAAATAETDTYAALRTALVDAGVEVLGDDDTLVIPNVAPDEGLSAPFNSWMTLFGQFFDHGLDLVNKGGNSIVMIPLAEDDPLFNPLTPQTNFMILTRATLDENGEATNATSPFVDQNQTYASTPSHQVFLREYVLDDAGRPVPTGNLIRGENGGMATWADVKAQAASVLGIELTDADVVRVPLLATDLYGNFVPGPNGFPQVMVDGVGAVEGNPNALVSAASALPTGHAFLIDIAHNAAPFDQAGQPLLPDDDGVPNDIAAPRPAGTYDDELLDAHFMAGDGRVNENFGLTAVHHVFHSEHNRLVEFSKGVILDSLANDSGSADEAAADLAFLNEWLRVDVSDLSEVDPQTLQWDGARLFQAAKFGTEMQYQHLVFEDFARKIQPQIDVFVAPVGYDVNIDPTIFAEFAHTVYRFGHSMLTETVDRFNDAFGVVGAGWDQSATAEQVGLIEAFLNPIEFDNGGAIDADVAAGAVVRGMTRQVGNEIDEFVTDALRSNLLGLPLDLASINLARGRELGIPTLNEARADFFAQTGDSNLRPYSSWVDFTLHLKNQTSVINFIAAYGTHASITSVETIAEKRDAAMKLVFGDDNLTGAEATAFNAERTAFLNGPAAGSGVNDIDLWVGGLAERLAPFGGMLGSTFNFVFETQLENLQNGDRFYYLARTAGMNFLAELEQNSFASMIVQNTDATHLPIDVFAAKNYILEVDQTRQFNADLGSADPEGGSIVLPLVIRDDFNTPEADSNYLQYTGADHVVLGGTDPGNAGNPSGNDVLIAGDGDDAIWGDGGDDVIEGGNGNDNIDGGAGDDIITDLGGDDVIKGGDGNDVIHGGPGINLLIGGRGSDFVVTGEDVTEVFAGAGNDFIRGTTTNEAPVGGDGDDWFEIGNQDGAAGDDSDPFGFDPIAGHDVFHGDGGFDEYVAEGGDDIMFGSFGINRNEGMSGFDWVAYRDLPTVFADLLLPAFDETPQPPSPDTAIDRYEAVEGLSGSHGDDVLLGSDVADLGAIDPAEPLVAGGNGQQGSILTAAGIARINGLGELMGNGVLDANGEFSTGNIILGGAGSDRIEGRGGNDVIDGDKWLNVRIQHTGEGVDGVTSWDFINNPLKRVDANGDGDLDPSLQSLVIDGLINPGDLQIVREILMSDGIGDIDTAVYLRNFAQYTVEELGGGVIRVTDNNLNNEDEGTDVLYNVELIQFNDLTFINSLVAIGAPAIDDTTPTEGSPLSANLGNLLDPNAIAGDIEFRWQSSGNGTNWVDTGATGTAFTPGEAEVNRFIRVAVTYTNGLGITEEVFSAPTERTGDLFNGTAANEDFIGTIGEDHAFGGGGNDTLRGRDGDDDLRGNGGNDIIVGGAGADVMRGGVGNDNYTGVELIDTVIEGTGINSGIDTIRTAEDAFTLPDNVENLFYIGTGNFAGTGNALANDIRGRQGNDILDGLGGADTMRGAAGDDLYIFDDVGDLALEGVGNGTDTVESSVTARLRNNVENLTLTGNADINGTGNGGDNVIDGNAGANLLNGGAGNDQMQGQGGNDDVRGAAGNDTLDGNGGADTLRGGNDADLLRGGDGNDVLRGQNGDDIMIGGAGNDNMDGQAGADVFEFLDEAFGNDIIVNFQDGVDLLDLGALVDVGVALGTETLVIDAINATRTIVTVQAADGNGGTVELGTIDVRGGGAPVTIDVDDFIA